MPDFIQEAREHFTYTRDLRRDFHRNPELAFHEIRTAGVVARELKSLNLEVSTGIARTGVVALLEGAKPGPAVLLRFDMDALPIQEDTGAEYASQNPGVMHACGHDGHTAIGLTAARILQKYRQDLAGTLKFVFQPAEEGFYGAATMVAEGVMENPKIDLTLALHLWNNKPLGWLGITAGPVMAAADIFKVTLTGKGGHGAIPDLAVDPVLTSAQVITALQSIVSRNVSPLQTAVVSVTMVRGGDAFNIIPSEVALQGTIRTYEKQVRESVLSHFHQIVTQVAGAMGCQSEIEITPLSPAVINDPGITRHVERTATRIFPDNQIDSAFRTMGSEDMSEMMEKVPGCYFFIGSANPEKGFNAPHHHPKFDVDETALERAVALVTATAYDLMKG